MPLNETSAARLCLQLVADWVQERTGAPVLLTPREALPDVPAFLADGTVGEAPVAVALGFIVPPEGEDPWYRAKAALERRLAARLTGGYLLWAPRGAALPEREPLTSDLIMRVEERAGLFVPGGHGDVRFPIVVRVRKSDEEGSYVTARGGLAPVWARFTNRVFGHYQIDSSDLYRLPPGEGHVTELIERIVGVANSLTLGETAGVEIEDAWAFQRLRGGDGIAIIGEPPGSELSSGAGLRRSLRKTVQAVHGPLLEREARARLLLLVGPYTHRDEQPAGTALLGFDPALYRGIDLIALAAEAGVKPLLDLSRTPIFGQRATGNGERDGERA